MVRGDSVGEVLGYMEYDTKDLIWRVQHFVPGRGRLCFFVDGVDAPETAPQAN